MLRGHVAPVVAKEGSGWPGRQTAGTLVPPCYEQGEQGDADGQNRFTRHGILVTVLGKDGYAGDWAARTGEEQELWAMPALANWEEEDKFGRSDTVSTGGPVCDYTLLGPEGSRRHAESFTFTVTVWQNLLGASLESPRRREEASEYSPRYAVRLDRHPETRPAAYVVTYIPGKLVARKAQSGYPEQHLFLRHVAQVLWISSSTPLAQTHAFARGHPIDGCGYCHQWEKLATRSLHAMDERRQSASERCLYNAVPRSEAATARCQGSLKQEFRRTS